MKEELREAVQKILNNYIFKRRFTFYNELAPIFGCGPREVDKFLEPADEYCKDLGQPPISTLVVNTDTNMPGDGYFKYHFSHDKRDKETIWVEQVKKINCNKYVDIFNHRSKWI
jgi:hypothetical protein